LKVVTLLFKSESVKPGTRVDYIGFRIPSDFVIGYGLDYAQRERNLKAIYRLRGKAPRAGATPRAGAAPVAPRTAPVEPRTRA
jgi:hypoxanthine phosphoribosyltransferase